MKLSAVDHDKLFDAIVIGTGFAGAVTAARLVEAGLSVCVLERGRRYRGNDFPMYPDAESLLSIDGGTKPSGAAPDLARWLWSIDQGLYDVRDLDDVVSVQAAGYGGGSLIYANVHLRAPDDVFRQGWPAVYRRETLDPYYDRVAYMLDVKPLPKGESLRKTNQLKGLERRLTGADGSSGLVQALDLPLAVTFASGEHDPTLSTDQRKQARQQREKERPWTQGQRQQTACDMRGQCWLGCRKGAKNSLDFNYLRIVEDAPEDSERGERLAHIHLGAEVKRIKRLGADQSPARYEVHYEDRLTTPNDRQGRDTDEPPFYKAKAVFIAAGAVNTTELLLRSKSLFAQSDSAGQGEATWSALGSRYFPNADSLAAVFDCEEPQDADRGPTITSALLYQNFRPVEAAEKDEGSDQKRFLWAIDFRSTPFASDQVMAALDPGAAVHLGENIDGKKTPPGEVARLVEPPIFDAGGFDEKSGVAMLVVEASDRFADGAGKTLTVRLDDGIWCSFGSTLRLPRKLEDWFLVEDGGYPTDIEPLLGMLRSPLWLRRNRFIEQIDQKGLIDQDARAPVADPGPLRFPLATAMESLLGVPRRSTSISSSLDDVSAEDALLAASPLDISLDKLLPEWFREALAADRDELAKALAPMVGQMLEAVLDDVAQQLVDRFDTDGLTENFTASVAGAIGDIPRERRADLVRGMLRQAIQLLWGSEVALAMRVNGLLMDRIPKDAYALANALAPLAGWLLNYREGNGHTALLLTMGRDQYRGRLMPGEAGRPLTARLPKPLAPTSRAAQEQVLRDIAREWRGELRTNPAWTALNRRITVHSQGGCPMCICGADDEDDACICMAVTRPDGQVRGCEGLYVMDAAAFPSAVGVNPSATIAAVAEYKVDRFIESELGKSVHAKWREVSRPRENDLARWLTNLKNDHDDDVLDPLAHIGAATETRPKSSALGLEFEEIMSGLFADVTAATPRRQEGAIDWNKLESVAERRSAFEQAERTGLGANSLLTLELKATIDDLDRFFRVQRRGLAMKIRLSGSIHVTTGAEHSQHAVDADQSYVQMFYRPPSRNDDQDQADAVERDQRPCYFRYRIVAAIDGTPFRIEAAKVLRDDPRFDLWQDLTTLYFEWFDGDASAGRATQAPSWRGILRMAPLDFFEKQLQTISITPTDADPARRSWAYGGFIRHFADGLAAVYVKRRGMIKAMAANLLDPSRGG